MGIYPTGDQRWDGRQVLVGQTERRWNEGLQAWRNAAYGRPSGPEPLRQGFRNSVLNALNLFGVWRLEEDPNGGVWYDAVGSFHFGDPAAHPTRVTGKRNYAVGMISGTNDRLQRSDTLVASQGQVSFSCWFQTNDTVIYNLLFNDTSSDGITYRLCVGLDASNHIQIYVRDNNGTTKTYTSGNTMSEDTWYHVAVAVDIPNDIVYVWVNATKWIDQTGVGFTGTTFYENLGSKLTMLGNGYYPGGGFQYRDKKIDEFYYFNDMFQQTHVNLLYNSGAGRWWYEAGEAP